MITDVHRFLLFLCGAAGYAFLPGPGGPLLQPVRGRGRQSQALHEIHAGVVDWLKTWQPNLDDAKARERATLYLKAMPAWADK